MITQMKTYFGPVSRNGNSTDLGCLGKCNRYLFHLLVCGSQSWLHTGITWATLKISLSLGLALNLVWDAVRARAEDHFFLTHSKLSALRRGHHQVGSSHF